MVSKLHSLGDLSPLGLPRRFTPSLPFIPNLKHSRFQPGDGLTVLYFKESKEYRMRSFIHSTNTFV